MIRRSFQAVAGVASSPSTSSPIFFNSSFFQCHLVQRFAAAAAAASHSSSSSGSSILHSELSKLFHLNEKKQNGRAHQQQSAIAITDVAAKLSDDALDELDATSLREWISANMFESLCVFAGSDGKYRVEPISSQSLPQPQHPQTNSTAAYRATTVEFSGTDADLHILMSAPAAPPPMPKSKIAAGSCPFDLLEQQRQLQERKERLKNRLAAGCNSSSSASTIPTELDMEQLNSQLLPIVLPSIPDPDQALHQQQQRSMSLKEQRLLEAEQRQIALEQERLTSKINYSMIAPTSLSAEAFPSVGMRMALCCPSFVVPLCHETMALLEQRIAEHCADESVKKFLAERKKQNGDCRQQSLSPLQRFNFLMGKEKRNNNNNNNNTAADIEQQLPFFLDESALEIIKLESFAPARDDVARWSVENPHAPRVDALVPEKMTGLIAGGGVVHNHAAMASNYRSGASAEEDGEGGDDGIDDDATEQAANSISKSSSAASSAAAAAAMQNDFESPPWISQHEVDPTDGKMYRYFFRLSPPYVADKSRFSVLLWKDDLAKKATAGQVQQQQKQQQQTDATPKDDVLLPLDDEVFSAYQIQEYDCFRLARCLPSNSVAITLKQLVVGGVLNLLSIPDLQFVLVSFPEMFEFPCAFPPSSSSSGGSSNNNNEDKDTTATTAPENLAVRFILAGSYDKPPTRPVSAIKAEMDELENAIKTRTDAATGKKLKGGTYMRRRMKYVTLKKQLAIALHPGPHPFKDPRVLAQLLFDLLPVSDCVPLSQIHFKLKYTEVQIGDSIGVQFFRRFPHLFHVVPMGTSETWGVLRADADPAALAVFMQRKPGSDDELLREAINAFRKIRRRHADNAELWDDSKSQNYSKVPRGAVVMEGVVVKLPISSRWCLEDIAIAARKRLPLSSSLSSSTSAAGLPTDVPAAASSSPSFAVPSAPADSTSSVNPSSLSVKELAEALVRRFGCFRVTTSIRFGTDKTELMLGYLDDEHPLTKKVASQ